jgi:hypothetical protein
MGYYLLGTNGFIPPMTEGMHYLFIIILIWCWVFIHIYLFVDWFVYYMKVPNAVYVFNLSTVFLKIEDRRGRASMVGRFISTHVSSVYHY